MYQIEGEQILYDWLANQPDVAKRERMIEFMADVAERPVVRYLVVEQFGVVKLGSFARAP